MFQQVALWSQQALEDYFLSSLVCITIEKNWMYTSFAKRRIDVERKIIGGTYCPTAHFSVVIWDFECAPIVSFKDASCGLEAFGLDQGISLGCLGDIGDFADIARGTL